jgi:uncharacterized YccA/Bax inhibitor family protein
MSILGPFHSFFAHLFHDPPGERFLRHHERFRDQKGEKEHPILRYSLLTFGVLLVLVGVVMLVLPGPGLLVILIGLVVIAARARGFAHWLDRSETAVRARIPERFRLR